MLLSTTCAVPWQLGLPSSCFFLLYCVGVHVRRQRAGSELAVPKSNSFFSFTGVFLAGFASRREGTMLNACGCGGTVAALI